MNILLLTGEHMSNHTKNSSKDIFDQPEENYDPQIFKYIFDHLDQAIICLNETGEIEYANKAVSVLTGFVPIELQKLQVSTLFQTPIDLSIEHNNFENEIIFNACLLAKNRKKTNVKLQLNKDNDSGLLVVFIEPQKSKNKRRKLKNNDLLNALMELIPDNIYFKNRKSQFIKVSKSMIKYMGFKKESDILGKTDKQC